MNKKAGARSWFTMRECVERLAASEPAAPVRSVAMAARPGTATLVDRRGQSHALGPVTRLGREGSSADVALYDDSVSRLHAELVLRPDGTAAVRDLGSTNGTFVDGVRVEGEAVVRDRQIVQVGNVSLVYLAAPSVTVAPVAPAAATMPAAIRLRVFASGDGELAVGERRATLSAVEVILVACLAEVRANDVGRTAAVRGFIRSAELSARLAEGDGQRMPVVRQQVLRVQRKLQQLAGQELLEASERQGYRMSVDVVIERR